MVVGDSCNVCGTPATNRCSSCLTISYCSKEHQRADWKKHKLRCVAYIIKEDKRVGRYLCANRTISGGEKVLKEKPLLSGPPQITGPVCLGCHNELSPVTSLPCPNCGWPMCSVNCFTSEYHKPECDWTMKQRNAKVKISQFVAPHPSYAAITPLRACYYREYNVEIWNKLQELESHTEYRRLDGKLEQERFAIAKLLLRFYKLENQFTEEEILRICGIIQINAHEVPLSEPGYVSVYWRCSLLEHDCRPNCSKSFSDSGEIVITACRDIKQGERLSICYTDPLWSTPARRLHLLTTKYFSCSCTRCSDPTEMETYFSAIRCLKQNCTGIALPNNFLDNPNQEWTCKTCNNQYKAEEVNTLLKWVSTELANVKKTNIESCKRFLDKMKNKLTEFQHQVVDVKLALVQLIGHSSDYRGLEHTSQSLLDFQEQLCRELIALADTLFPAECRLRGVLYFELHATVADKARRLSNCKDAEKSSAQVLLMESGNYLNKCIELLKHEPKALAESKIYEQALENKKDLNNLYKLFNK